MSKSKLAPERLLPNIGARIDLIKLQIGGHPRTHLATLAFGSARTAGHYETTDSSIPNTNVGGNGAGEIFFHDDLFAKSGLQLQRRRIDAE